MSELLCKVLFIDLDDTIWDFRANSVLSLRQVYDEFALKKEIPDYDRFKSLYMATNHELWELHDRYLDVLSQQKTLVPGAVELLDYLTERGYPLYILSNGFAEVQSRKLESGGISHYFKRLILSDEIGITKPDRRLFDYALQIVGAAASETLIVGDNYDADILGAMNAGWKTIYFNRDNLVIPGARPDYTATSLSEIKQIL